MVIFITTHQKKKHTHTHKNSTGSMNICQMHIYHQRDSSFEMGRALKTQILGLVLTNMGNCVNNSEARTYIEPMTRFCFASS